MNDAHAVLESFAAALLDPDRPAPVGLSTWNGSDPAARFGVYRNNVAVSLIGALADTFPVTRELVGAPFFDAMARCFVAAEPPRSPVLAEYGNTFPDFVSTFPPAAGPEWLDTRAFTAPFAIWQRQIEDRRDVFLGYCSASTSTAQLVKAWLTVRGVKVLDWQTDFPPGRNILQQIGEAAARCSGGIFLFTCDDEVAEPGPGHAAVPRDNVVFEAGFFVHAKGKERVLVIREEGAKMPADLGGDIYASLTNRDDIAPIEAQLQRFTDVL